jgi:hypothetical protein
MKKLLALVASTILVVSFATPAQSAGAKYTVYQKTLATFSSSATTLTSQQKAQVRATVEANPDAEKFICTGIRYYSQPMSINIMVRKRAKAACEYAKQLNPELSTWFQNKPTQARSYAGKVLLTVKTPDLPAPAIDLDSYDPSVVSSTARERVDEYLLRVSDNAPIKFSIIAGPSIPDTQIELERSRVIKSAQFWSSMYDFEPTIFVYGGGDAEWMVSQLNARGNYFHDNLIKSSFWEKTGVCAQSLAVHTADGPYYINCHRDGIEGPRMSPIAAHEFAHLPMTAKFQNQPGGPFSPSPIWVNEGGAEFFGISLTEQARKEGDYWHRLHMNSRSLVSISTRSDLRLNALLGDISKSEAVELMTAFEDISGLSSDGAYALGKWATELLVASEGVDTYMAFLNAMGPNSDWKAAFEEAYGMSTSLFYERMVPYFHWLASEF